MIEKEVIDAFILVGENSSNSIVQLDYLKADLLKSFKGFILDLKVQIDRWDLLTSDFLVHISLKPFVEIVFKNILNVIVNSPNEETYQIWGANLHFTSLIDPDKVLAIDLKNIDKLEDPSKGQHIAVGHINAKKILKFNELKAFW